ncbi:MAG: formimidoylglutamase, partial [Flavobacteriaceae bacterium]
EIGKQYGYQFIKNLNLNHSSTQLYEGEYPDIALLGYACDEGVRRNKGRVGALEGPDVLKHEWGKLSYHHYEKRVVDLGNLICPDRKMENCQKELSNCIHYLLANSIFPIVLGGGHDMAYGHFKGLWEFLKSDSKSRIGIINFDAHFDLRPLLNQAHSGTPFYQILMEHPKRVDYFAIGIQESSNSPELFDIARKNQVEYLLNHECNGIDFQAVTDRLATFVEKNDYLYLSVDMDGFSSAFAPGVSAPSPMGLDPFFVLKTLQYLFHTQKVISCDIAELNPRFDSDQQTANLAARLVDFIISAV